MATIGLRWTSSVGRGNSAHSLSSGFDVARRHIARWDLWGAFEWSYSRFQSNQEADVATIANKATAKLEALERETEQELMHRLDELIAKLREIRARMRPAA